MLFLTRLHIFACSPKQNIHQRKTRPCITPDQSSIELSNTTSTWYLLHFNRRSMGYSTRSLTRKSWNRSVELTILLEVNEPFKRLQRTVGDRLRWDQSTDQENKQLQNISRSKKQQPNYPILLLSVCFRSSLQLVASLGGRYVVNTAST